MTGKLRALVTGGGKRIGAGLVKHLSKMGFAVTIHVWQSSAEAQELLKSLPGSADHSISVCDFSDPEARKQWLQNIGSFDLVINNASVYRLTAPGTEETRENRQRYWQVNYLAAVEITAHMMKNKPNGAAQTLVINMLDSDILDHNGGVKTPHEPPAGEDSYLYSRIMLGQLTKIMAVESAPELRINGIAPGPVLPPVNCKTKGMTEILKSVPLNRPAGVEEIASAVEFFWNTPSLTGVILPIDGGKHLNNIL